MLLHRYGNLNGREYVVVQGYRSRHSRLVRKLVKVARSLCGPSVDRSAITSATAEVAFGVGNALEVRTG
jgi:hypothetical protein